MKPIFLSLVVCSLASAAAPAALEPLGQPCRGFNVLASRVVKAPDGKEYFVLSNTNETSGVELIFIDFANNTGRKFTAPAGQGAWALNQVPGDRLIVGTYYDGKMMVFDLKAMKFTKVIPFPGEEYFWNACLGSDGRLYGGTYPHAKLGALDLDTLTMEDCGAPAPPNLYCRNVSATPDGRILCNFVTEKQTTKLFDPKTKKWSDVPASIRNVQRAVVWNGYMLSVGNWDSSKSAEGAVAFKGENFEPVDPPPFPTPPDDKNTWAVDPNLTSADTLYLRRGNAWFRLGKGESALTKVFEQTLRGGAITAVASDGTLLGIRGQDYVVVRPSEKEAKLLPIPVEPGPRGMHFIKVDDAGRLWGGPPFGQTLFWVDLATKKFTNTGIVCDSGGEVYDVAFGDGVVYAVAYVGGDVIVYDPNQPWDQIGGKNPRTLAHLTNQGYIRPTGGVRLASDGRLYSGWMAKYGSYGGAIAITDRKTGKTDLIENPLARQAITALDVDAGAKLAYAGTGLHGNGLPNKANEKPQFGVIDLATRKVAFQQPIDGGEVSGIAFDAKTGLVAVVAERKLRLFDPAAKSFVDAPADAPPVTAHPLVSHGDGTVWYASGKAVVRLDLSTKAGTRIPLDVDVQHLSVDKAGVVYIASGPDLYRFKP